MLTRQAETERRRSIRASWGKALIYRRTQVATFFLVAREKKRGSLTRRIVNESTGWSRKKKESDREAERGKESEEPKSAVGIDLQTFLRVMPSLSQLSSAFENLISATLPVTMTCVEENNKIDKRVTQVIVRSCLYVYFGPARTCLHACVRKRDCLWFVSAFPRVVFCANVSIAQVDGFCSSDSRVEMPDCLCFFP